MCLPDLLHVLVSVAGFRNAGSPSLHRMQRTPPPPPPGHRGTYRVPTGILTRATHPHQAPRSATATPPQRGAPYHTQTTAHFTPQPRFPPPPPTTIVLPHHISPRQPYSPISPSQSTSSCHSTPPILSPPIITTIARPYMGTTYPKQSKQPHTLRSWASQAAQSRPSLF